MDDKWRDVLQINLMYVCARTLVSHNPELAKEIAVWHLSVYSSISETKLAFETAQKFHKGAFHLQFFKSSFTNQYVNTYVFNTTISNTIWWDNGMSCCLMVQSLF